MKHLFRQIAASNMGLHFQKMVGYIDTLPLMKHLFPNEQSYSQIHLYRRILGSSYMAHDSLEDVKALGEILRFIKCDSHIFIQFSMTSLWAKEYFCFISQNKSNIESLYPLLQSNAMSKGMVEKAASSVKTNNNKILRKHEEKK